MVSLALWQLASGPDLRAQTSAPSSASKTAGPSARFAEMSVNFNKVMPTELQRHVFIVTNAGAAPLQITDVAAGCGCTTTGGWDKEIAPGKTGRIPIEFNPVDFSGEIHKSMVVTTNDPLKPTQILDIYATVWRPFEITPKFTSFLPVEGEPRAETKVVRIVSHLPAPAKLEAPQSSNPQFKTELKAVREGSEYELRITYDSAIPGTSLNTTITIKTSSAEQPLLSATAFAMPQPALITIPATLQLPAGRLGAGVIHNIVVRNNSSTPLKLSEAAATGEGIRVTVTEPQPGRMFYVSVAFPAGYVASGETPAVITVKTSNPKFPEIRVPIVPAELPAGTAAVAAGK